MEGGKGGCSGPAGWRLRPPGSPNSRRWKAEALVVLGQWDPRSGKRLAGPGPLRSSKAVEALTGPTDSGQPTRLPTSPPPPPDRNRVRDRRDRPDRQGHRQAAPAPHQRRHRRTPAAAAPATPSAASPPAANHPPPPTTSTRTATRPPAQSATATALASSPPATDGFSRQKPTADTCSAPSTRHGRIKERIGVLMGGTAGSPRQRVRPEVPQVGTLRSIGQATPPPAVASTPGVRRQQQGATPPAITDAYLIWGQKGLTDRVLDQQPDRHPRRLWQRHRTTCPLAAAQSQRRRAA